MPAYKKLIYGFIAFMIVFYGYQYITRPIKGVEDDVRPYLEDCLDLIINKEFDEIYEQYFVGKRQISIEEFNDRMKYLAIIFGEPISYDGLIPLTHVNLSHV